jgi:hypothetical protein
MVGVELVYAQCCELLLQRTEILVWMDDQGVVVECVVVVC